MCIRDRDTGERKTITVSYVNIKNDADVDGTIISEVSNGKDGVKVKLADRMKALQSVSYTHLDVYKRQIWQSPS